MKNLELKASAYNTRFFTKNMLYSIYLKGSVNSVIVPLIIATIFCGFISLFLITALSYVGLFIAVILFGVAIKMVLKINSPMNIGSFSDYYQRWIDSGRNNTFIVTKPMLTNPPPTYKENDIFDYGVDRVVIVDDPLFVDCLILNEEHIKSKALIISKDGYPHYLKGQLRKILDQSDNIPVILLHGTDQNKPKIVTEIESNYNVKLVNQQVYDLGYYENQIKQAKSLYKRMRITKCTVDMLPYHLSTQLMVKDRSELKDMLVLGAAVATTSYVGFSLADDFG